MKKTRQSEEKGEMIAEISCPVDLVSSWSSRPGTFFKYHIQLQQLSVSLLFEEMQRCARLLSLYEAKDQKDPVSRFLRNAERTSFYNLAFLGTVLQTPIGSLFVRR